MPPTPPTSEPKTLIIGANWEWDRTYSDGPPSDGYTLTYEFNGPSQITKITAATSSSGDYYEVRVAKAATVDLIASTYLMVGRVDKGTDGFQIYEAEIDLKADWTDAGAIDELTTDEFEAKQLTAAIQTLQLNPFAVTQVNGRRVEFADLDVLHERRGNIWAKIITARNQGQFPKRKVRNVAIS